MAPTRAPKQCGKLLGIDSAGAVADRRVMTQAGLISATGGSREVGEDFASRALDERRAPRARGTPGRRHSRADSRRLLRRGTAICYTAPASGRNGRSPPTLARDPIFGQVERAGGPLSVRPDKADPCRESRESREAVAHVSHIECALFMGRLFRPLSPNRAHRPVHKSWRPRLMESLNPISGARCTADGVDRRERGEKR